MLISHKFRFIFVHIYKNAGISITNALMPYAATEQQLKLENLLGKIGVSYLRPIVIREDSSLKDWGSDILNKSFKRLIFLKNRPQPLLNHVKANEIISFVGKESFNLYFSFGIVRNPWDWQVSLYKFGLENIFHPQRKLFMKFGSFENYIHWRCKEDVRFQKDFLFSKNNDQLVSFIGRYENLQKDFQTICKRIGINATLPVLNRSTKSKPYQEYYTPETIQLVRKTFTPDIELFGYEY